MTGLAVRARVDGRWVSLDVDELPGDALVEWASGLEPAEGRRWAVELCRWIGANVKGRPTPALALEGWADRLEGGDARAWVIALVLWIRGHAAPPAPAFTCPECGRISHLPGDVEHRYCGACHKFF
jgi:hypothetical protein